MIKTTLKTFFILLTASGLYGQTTYNGSDLTVRGSVVSVSQLNITDSGTITDIDIKITFSMSAYQAYEYLNLSLISPSGTSVKLIKKTSLTNDTYNMILNDEASQSLSDGSPPYADNFKPDNPLYYFDGESISGNWELVVSNLQGFDGTVKWSLLITSDSSTPLSAPNFGTEYAGSQISIAGSSTTVGNLTIPGDISITDLNIKLTVSMSAYQGFEYIRLLLKSDQITYYPFAEKHFSGNMYKTIIDDEAIQKKSTSTDWSSPHIGSHQSPNSPLDSFDGLKASNSWELIVTNSQGFDGTLDWSLLVNSPLESPTVSTSTTVSSLTDNTLIPITITFSEYVNGFELSDISVTNGTVSNFSGSGTTYTCSIIPSIDSGNIALNVSENVAVSKANYGNQAATQLGIVYRKELNAPAAPTGLSTKYGNKKIKLTWSKNSESDVAKYYIYQGVSSNPTTLVDSTLRNDDTTKVFTDLTNGQAYYYRVKAIDNYGNISDYSSSISTTPNPEILTVKKDGTGNYTTIKDAATNAIEGDTILIYEGNYQESNILNTEKNLTFASEYILDNDTTHISKTVISASTKSTFAIQTYSNCEIKGLTFNSGYFRIGGKVSHSTFNETGHLRLKDKAEIISCRFYDAGKNSSSDEGRGGAIYAVSSDSIRIVNSLFVCNIDLAYSNHIYFENVKGVEIINSTFISTKDKPAIYYHQNNTTGKIINSIFKQSHRAFLVPTGTPSEKFQVYNSLFDIGNGEIVDNNLYINLNSTLSARSLLNDDFSLSDYSPAIGGGTKSHAPSDDILGNPRPSPAGSFPDLGAFENSRSEPLPHNTKIYVSKDGNDEGVGLENSPFKTIRAAVGYSKSGDSVFVGKGTYNEIDILIQYPITLKSLEGADSTIIDGLSLGRIMDIDAEATIRGITFTNGYKTNDAAGGIAINSTATNSVIDSCRFINNQTDKSGDYFGGAIGSRYAKVTISNSYFEGNTGREGGAIGLRSDNGSIITNCVFKSNVSTDSGSAVEIVYDDSDLDTTRIINSIFINEGRNVIEKEHTFDRLEIDNCQFYGGNGKVLNLRSTNNSLTNSIFKNRVVNEDSYYTMIDVEGAIDIENCSFISNQFDKSNLIYTTSGFASTIKNSKFLYNTSQNMDSNRPFLSVEADFTDCIFFGNEFSNNNFNYFLRTNPPQKSTFEYSLTDFEIEQGYSKLGNIFKRPLFCLSDTTYSKVAANSPLLGSSVSGGNIGGVISSCDPIDATKIYISNELGSDENKFGLRSSPYATFSKALNDYFPNDTIIVMEGTYTKDIELNGDYYIISEKGPQNTIINLENNINRTIQIYGSLELEGFTIKNTRGVIVNGDFSNNIIFIRECIFVNNKGDKGAAIFSNALEGMLNISNCTFINNIPDAGGNGPIFLQNSNASIINNIIWDNYPIEGLDTVNFNNIVKYNILKNESNWKQIDSTQGNISDDPLFLNESENNFNLTFYSPAIDAGDPNYPKDPDGTRSDIGALYFDKRDIVPPTINLLNLTNSIYLGGYLPIAWTTTDNFPTDTIKIKLEYNINFGAGVWNKIADSLANNSDYTWQVPNIPSDNGGIKITATDFGGNMAVDSAQIKFEIDYPSVSLDQLSNTTVKISEVVPIKWSTAITPAVQSVDLYYTIDDGTNWKDMSLNEENDGEYLWAVPNEPTTTAGLRIVAKEQFGYKDTADVKGLKIEIEYPTISSVYPAAYYIWWKTNEFKFKTNIVLDSQTLNNNSVILTNSQADYGYSVTQSNDTITVKFASTLITYDSISIKLDASQIKSPYGYGLDGDGDGTPGDDFTMIRKVFMPIDYDYSGTITASDVSLFVDYFKSNDSKWEPAPIASGTVPYVVIAPDGKYDIDDMLTFVQFGNWYLQGASGKVADDIGNTPISLDTTIQSKDYTVSFSELTQAIEVYVKYDPLKLTPIIEPTSGEIKLGHHDTEKGIISLIVYNPSGENIRLKWNQLDKKSESNISVLVKTTDENGQETVKRTMLKVISVPSEFALHDNYPNPFNPTTTFRFDVPEVSDVTLSIYNMLGQRVRTFNHQNTSAGYHSVTWDATNDLGDQVGAGVYLYQLRAKQFVKTRKMVLLK